MTPVVSVETVRRRFQQHARVPETRPPLKATAMGALAMHALCYGPRWSSACIGIAFHFEWKPFFTSSFCEACARLTHHCPHCDTARTPPTTTTFSSAMRVPLGAYVYCLEALAWSPGVSTHEGVDVPCQQRRLRMSYPYYLPAAHACRCFWSLLTPQCTWPLSSGRSPTAASRSFATH